MSRSPRGVHPDTVYYGGRILTMDGDRPQYAEAVVISQGLIVYVGSRAAAVERFPQAVARDLAGATMLPGFIDAHSHLLFAIDLVDQVAVGAPPLGSCTDIPAVIEALEAFRVARDIPADGWIIGWGYDENALAESRHISKSELDAAFPGNRVALLHVSSHGAVLNSRALDWAGIDASTPTPVGGVIARIADTNEPSGLLMETGWLLVRDRMPKPTGSARFDLLDNALQMYASQGYTHVQEGFTSVADMDFLQDAARRGLLYLDVMSLGSFIEAQTWIGNDSYPTGDYSGGYKIAGMKIVGDGSPQAKTAVVTVPYLTGGPGGEPGWRGRPTLPYEQLAALVKYALDAGAQVFVHANGDATIDSVINAVRDAGVTAAEDRRTVMIHSQFQRPDHFGDYLKLGITPSYFTSHTYFWGDVHSANLGVDRASFISPMRSTIEHGLMVSNHSDFTVTPLNPFFIMWTAMTRTTRSGAILGVNERLDAYAALQALTTGPAYQAFEESRKGRIAEGLLADFVILSADPVELGQERIREITVLETIKEGVTVFTA